eukprot:13271247-Heterocapsa_arctica.AAC.1
MQAHQRAQFAKCACCLAFYFPACARCPQPSARLDWLRPARGSSDSHSQKGGPADQLASCARQGRQGTLGEPGSLQPAEPAQG